MNNCQMGPSCHGLQEQNARLDKYLGEGMTREQVRAAFVAAAASQDVLTAPIDEGFNRLAWLLPYVIGLAGAGAAAFAARRWAHRDGGDLAYASAGHTDDAELRSRLDEELRDLD